MTTGKIVPFKATAVPYALRDETALRDRHDDLEFCFIMLRYAIQQRPHSIANHDSIKIPVELASAERQLQTAISESDAATLVSFEDESADLFIRATDNPIMENKVKELSEQTRELRMLELLMPSSSALAIYGFVNFIESLTANEVNQHLLVIEEFFGRRSNFINTLSLSLSTI